MSVPFLARVFDFHESESRPLRVDHLDTKPRSAEAPIQTRQASKEKPCDNCSAAFAPVCSLGTGRYAHLSYLGTAEGGQDKSDAVFRAPSCMKPSL